MSPLNKDQLSLILYLETRAVDYGGRVDMRRMNKQDADEIDKWVKDGFIHFGRISYDDFNGNGTHWVELTDGAFDMAHAERKARAIRMMNNRRWTKTGE